MNKSKIPDSTRESIISRKREKLFRSLAVIHVTAKIQQIAYFDAIKETNFAKPKIKSKANQIEKFSLDIITSIGDAVTLKKEFEDYMEYEHFTELYDLLKMLLFIDTDSIRNLAKVLKGEITPATEEELRQIVKEE